MKSLSIQSTASELSASLEKVKSIAPQLLVVFTSSQILSDKSVTDKIRAAIPAPAHIVGCSTSGEIGDRVDDNSIALLAMSFNNTPLGVTSINLTGGDQSREGGKSIAKNLLRDGLRGVFVLAPGKDINGSRLVEGMREELPKNVAVFGGLAGGGVSFGTTYTILDDTIAPNQIVAVGLYGDKIRISTGSQGGWKTFGPLRKVTKAVDNVLYELDDKPALDLYKQYLGEKAKELPGSGLLYPFAILNKETKAPELIRTILAINEEDKSLVFAGNIDEGSDVSLMHAGNDALVNGASEAAEKIANHAALTSDSATICISCIGRKLLMGNDTEDELDAVKDVLGSSQFLGFYSNGEISALSNGGTTELHNQTMTITYLYEDAA